MLHKYGMKLDQLKKDFYLIPTIFLHSDSEACGDTEIKPRSLSLVWGNMCLVIYGIWIEKEDV